MLKQVIMAQVVIVIMIIQVIGVAAEVEVLAVVLVLAVVQQVEEVKLLQDHLMEVILEELEVHPIMTDMAAAGAVALAVLVKPGMVSLAVTVVQVEMQGQVEREAQVTAAAAVVLAADPIVIEMEEKERMVPQEQQERMQQLHHLLHQIHTIFIFYLMINLQMVCLMAEEEEEAKEEALVQVKVVQRV